MEPTVTLVNYTRDPLETVWVLWQQSKIDGPTSLDVDEVKRTVPRADLEALFWDVLRQKIPISENIHFLFVLEGVSISLREQMVRHRIGTHFGDNYGVDTVPDLAQSSWWSQSMRIQDMGGFADRGMYRVPDTLAGKSVGCTVDGSPRPGGDALSKISATDAYTGLMRQIQQTYSALVESGVPMEDARELIPLGAQHRISWDLNLAALQHIVAKRGCWILQLGIWGPIIHGMINQIATKVHPMFARIVAPPCISADDKFTSCQYRLENQRRVPDMQGEVPDAHPPCPLWLCRDETGRAALNEELDVTDDIVARELHRQNATPAEVLINSDDLVPRHREMKARAEQYRALWLHDPYTWEPTKDTP